MTNALLIELGWKSLLVSGLVLLLLALLKQRSAAERALVAHAGLLLLLVLPAAPLAAPRWEVEASTPLSRLLVPQVPVVEVRSPLAQMPAASPQPIVRAQDVAPWIYTVVAGAIIGLLLLALLRLSLLHRRSDVLVEPRWLTALAKAQRRMKVRHGTALLVNEQLSSPISWGVLRPVILLDPAAAAAPDRAEAIIAHELAHVARLDWAKLLLAHVVTALFWFNPLVWKLARTAHELREEAADDAVLRSEVAGADYAELLLRAADSKKRRVLLPANGVAPRAGSLLRRIERLFDQSQSRAPARIGWAAACCLIAVGLGAPLSALSFDSGSRAPLPVAGAPERSSGAAAHVGKLASSPSLPRSGSSSTSFTSAAPAETPTVRFATPQPESADHFNPTTPAPLAPMSGTPAERLPLIEATLVRAAEVGDRQTLARLLDIGISPDAIIAGDGSPLIASARAGRMDLVAMLLGRGASINLGVNGDGNPLIVAAAAGHLNVVRYLLDHGANIEAIVPSDENALMQASRFGRVDVVRLLLDRGANPNSRDGSRTPLREARRGGNAQVVRMLIAAGARQ